MDLPLPSTPRSGRRSRSGQGIQRAHRPDNGRLVSLPTRGCFVAADDTLARLLGHNVRDLIGRHTTDFVHAGSRGLLRRQIERIASSDRRNYRLELMHRDGSVIPDQHHHHLQRSRRHGQRSAGFITDLRAVEALAAPHEAELRAILDNLQDTYYRTDASGRLLRLSPSIQQLLGYHPDELIGTLAADLYVGAMPPATPS
jgi:PAS domain S-box-containing protein